MVERYAKDYDDDLTSASFSALIELSTRPEVL